MNTLSFISISIFFLKIPSILAQETPRQILDKNCPCFPSQECLVPQLDSRLDKKLPPCPPDHRRCCSKGDVLAAVSEVIKLNGLKASQVRLPSVECVAISVCEVTYGSLTSHFEDFGFINPLDRNCLARDGNVLCIVDPNSAPGGTLTATTAPDVGEENVGGVKQRKPLPISDTEPENDYEDVGEPQLFFAAPSDQPERRTRLLPCVPLDVCEEVYDFGEKGHLDRYGPQHECYEFQSVRCVQLHSSVLPKPSNDLVLFPSESEPFSPPVSMLQEPSEENISLPCVPEKACKLVYEANENHMTQFGYQEQCQHLLWVRCLQIDLALFPKNIVDMLSPTNTDPGHLSLLTNTDPDHISSPNSTDQYQLELPSGIDSNDLPFSLNIVPYQDDFPSETYSDYSDYTDQYDQYDQYPNDTYPDDSDYPDQYDQYPNDLPFSLNNVPQLSDLPSETNTDPDYPSLSSNQHQLQLPSGIDPNDQYQFHFPNDGNIDSDHTPLPTTPAPLTLPIHTHLSRSHSPSAFAPALLPCVPQDECEQIYNETTLENCHKDDHKTISHIIYVRCIQVKPSPQNPLATPTSVPQQVPGVTIFSTKPIYITSGSLFGGPLSVQRGEDRKDVDRKDEDQPDEDQQDQPDESQKDQIFLLLAKIISRLDNLVKKRNLGGQSRNLV